MHSKPFRSKEKVPGKLGVVVPFEEVEDAEDPLGRDEQLELIPGRQLHLLDELGQALRRVLPELAQRLTLLQVELPDGR